MTTTADLTTRLRDEIYSDYVAYQALDRRRQDRQDEVDALGGPVGIYGAAGVNFPDQGDGFEYDDMVAAFPASASLVGEPTQDQKNAIIKARRE